MKPFLLLLLTFALLAGCTTPKKIITFLPTPDRQPGDAVGMPDKFNRPDSLIPGFIPHRVRYKFASDELVLAAHDHIDHCLSSGEYAKLVDDLIFVFPGAWSHYKTDPNLGKTDFIVAPVQVEQSGDQKLVLDGIILKDPEERIHLAQRLYDTVTEHGGYTIHAMTTAEMRLWWVFIPFDIEEPTFVVETKDHSMAFILALNSKTFTINVLDEISALRAVGISP